MGQRSLAAKLLTPEIVTSSLRDFSMRSRAGDQSQEELPVCSGDVVTVRGLACCLADGRAMHDGTPHWVLVALVL